VVLLVYLWVGIIALGAASTNFLRSPAINRSRHAGRDFWVAIVVTLIPPFCAAETDRIEENVRQKK